MATGSVSAPTELTCTCPAKVNLALSVGPPDARGYHPIASWMVAVDFGDTLTLRRLDAGPSTFDIAYADDAPRPEPIDWPLEKDLAVRAHALLEAEVGRPLPVHATLRKRIPTGAGLGGGSSDAAAMLAGVNKLLKLGLTMPDLVSLAARLGSDVPFAVHVQMGQVSALVGGFGEQITPRRMSARMQLYLVLLMPPLRCPTSRVYAAFDRLNPAPQLDADRVERLAFAEDLDADALFNDLAEPAMIVEPGLRDLQSEVEASVGRRVHVTGSGATLFCTARSLHDLNELTARLAATTEVPCITVRPWRPLMK